MQGLGLPDWGVISGLSGGALVVFVLVMLISLGLTILPLNWAARAMRARKTGCLTGIAVVFISPILAGVLSFALGLVLPVIGNVLAFLITIVAEALMIKPLYNLSFGKSLLTSMLWLVFRIIFWAVLWVVLVLFFSLLGIGLS